MPRMGANFIHEGAELLFYAHQFDFGLKFLRAAIDGPQRHVMAPLKLFNSPFVPGQFKRDDRWLHEFRRVGLVRD